MLPLRKDKPMEKRYITIKEIWQDKPARYAMLSIVVLVVLAIVAPFFPHLGLLWIAAFVLFAMVYVVSMWITTAHERKGV